MSYFKVILTLLLSLHASSSLMGMDTFWNWWNKKEPNHYFEPELQKTLSLLMAKNNNPDSIDLDKDTILVIAKNNYDLYCNELLTSKVETQSFKDFWEKQLNEVNNIEKIKASYGQKIEINDFDFLTMNDQGRKIFLTTIPMCKRDKSRECFSQGSIITTQKGIELNKNLFNQHEYKKILQLPLRLRSKFGNLSYAMIIEKEHFSCENAFFDSGLVEGCMSSCLALLPSLCIARTSLNQYLTILTCAGIYGVGSYHIQKKHETFPAPTTLIQLFDSHALSNKEIREYVLQRHYQYTTVPLVPEKYAETLAFEKQTKQEFQRSKDYMIHHHKKNTHKLLTQE